MFDIFCFYFHNGIYWRHDNDFLFVGTNFIDLCVFSFLEQYFLALIPFIACWWSVFLIVSFIRVILSIYEEKGEKGRSCTRSSGCCCFIFSSSAVKLKMKQLVKCSGVIFKLDRCCIWWLITSKYQYVHSVSIHWLFENEELKCHISVSDV